MLHMRFAADKIAEPLSPATVTCRSRFRNDLLLNPFLPRLNIETPFAFDINLDLVIEQFRLRCGAFELNMELTQESFLCSEHYHLLDK